MVVALGRRGRGDEPSPTKTRWPRRRSIGCWESICGSQQPPTSHVESAMVSVGRAVGVDGRRLAAGGWQLAREDLNFTCCSLVVWLTRKVQWPGQAKTDFWQVWLINSRQVTARVGWGVSGLCGLLNPPSLSLPPTPRDPRQSSLLGRGEDNADLLQAHMHAHISPIGPGDAAPVSSHWSVMHSTSKSECK